jgi:hypothetical protein
MLEMKLINLICHQIIFGEVLRLAVAPFTRELETGQLGKRLV